MLPSAAQRRSETGRRSEAKGRQGKGSRAGLTPWPPTAGAEAATRPASLRGKAEGAAWQQTPGERGLGWSVAGGRRGRWRDTPCTLAHIY